MTKAFNFFFFFAQTMQILDEEKSKLDNFCEQSLKNVSIAYDVYGKIYEYFYIDSN